MNNNNLKSEDSLFSENEPWESWETILVLSCIAIGTTGLLILAWLVNKFILIQ